MRRDVFAALRYLVWPTLAVLFIAAFFPGRLSLAIRIYALLLCAAALVIVLMALRRAYPPATPLRPPRGRRARGQRPGSLSRLEHVAALGVAGTFDLHYHLRPRMRAIAHGLLLTRRRVSLDDDPTSARDILGPETYDLVRADRPPPVDRLLRGVTVPELRHVVVSLERV